VLAGGFGSAVLEALAELGTTPVTVKRLGIDDIYVEHGRQDILRRKYGLDAQGILEAAGRLLGVDRG
jgi:1-deoxy-D-xylulose-5-phosphate synthase